MRVVGEQGRLGMVWRLNWGDLLSSSNMVKVVTLLSGRGGLGGLGGLVSLSIAACAGFFAGTAPNLGTGHLVMRS